VSGRGEDLIAATQHVLSHYLRRNVRIARLGEVAVRGAADEATFALRIKPAGGFSIWNYRGDWCARSLLLSAAAAATASTASWSALRTLSAASPLIAPASSIVAIVAALAGVTLIAIALLLLTAVAAATTASFAARGLRIVRCLLLLLLLWRRAAVTRAIGRAVGGGGGR